MEESWASSPAARNTMQGNRGRDAKAELAVRRIVHAQGLRYRVNARPELGIRRTADLLFTGARVAVVHRRLLLARLSGTLHDAIH